MDLRQVNDGHVLTIRSILGHMIRLTVQGGRAVLELSETVGGSGSDASGGGGTINGTVLQEGVFTPVVSCLKYPKENPEDLPFHLYMVQYLDSTVKGAIKAGG